MQNSLWIDRSEYPFQPKFCSIKGSRMHYVDEGKGYPILMLHGTPTWSFLYRHLIKGLSPHFRCIAPDLLGFGLSDHPKNWSYKPEAHAESLDYFIQNLGLTRFALLVHDYGGPIGLSFAINHLGIVDHLILCNTWMWSLKGDPTYEKASRLMHGWLGPFLYEHTNYPARILRQEVEDKTKLSEKILRQYLQALHDPASRHGAAVLAREWIDSSDWFDSLWRRREAIKDTPTLILWGMHDPLIKIAALENWTGLFTDMHMVRYAQAGHLLPEECGPALCSVIEGFLIGKMPEYVPPEEEVSGLDRHKQPLDLDTAGSATKKP